MNTLHTLKNEEWLKRLADARGGLSEMLYAMYSSLTGGITTDPALMGIPVDDHLANFGQGHELAGLGVVNSPIWIFLE